MKLNTFRMSPLAIALAALMLVGCGDDDLGLSDEPGTVRVLMTDAPADYIESAWVDIGAVQLVPAEGEDDEGGIITLSEDGTDGMIDLLELQDAATTELASVVIEAGTYAQLRLIVDSATVELKEGYQFNDGSTSQTLFVPSGAQTGIKLNLGAAGDDEEEGAGVRIAGGETVLVLDFDVTQSFVIQGDPETPAGINGIIFTPTLRVTVQDIAGSVSGTVTAAHDSILVSGLVVTAEPLDEGTVEDYQTTTATATTGDDGSYTIHYLVPGSYSVSVAAEAGFVAAPASTDVTVGDAEAVSGVDFTVDEEDSASD